MNIPPPIYISHDELMVRLQREVASLDGSGLVWWKNYCTSPFPALHGKVAHYVVAVAGEDIVFFADDEDEFGFAHLEPGSVNITNYGLAGDLKDAINLIQGHS